MRMKAGVHGAFSSSRDNNTIMSSSRSRPLMKWNYYSMMNNNAYVVTGILMLVFGAGILGVMGIHRVRERRVFEITIKDKEQQLLSLNILLQKEKEHVHEYKKKTDELKTKIYSLRNQMTELNGRVLEMQATISSLKDEQKIIEKALEEKQNEATSLRDRYNGLKDRNPQVEALTETLRQRESELEDLRSNLQAPPNKSHTGNVSTDETGLSENGVVNANGQSNVRTEEISERVETESVNSSSLGDNEHETEPSNNNNEPHDPVSIETDREQKGDGTEKDESHTEANIAKEDDQTKALGESQVTVNRKAGDAEGGVKLEIQENVFRGKRYRRRGKYGYLKRAKAKIRKQTEAEVNNGSNLGKGTRVGEENRTEQVKMRDSNMGSGFRDKPVLNQQFVADDALGQVKASVKSDSRENNEESPPQSMLTEGEKPVETDEVNKFRASLHEELTDAASNGMESTSSNEGSVQKIKEDDKSNEQDIAVEKSNEKQENNGGQKEATESNDDQKSIRKEEIEETGSGANTSKDYEQISEEENGGAKQEPDF